MRLLFRVDGNRQMGGGHITRCLALAEAGRRAGHWAGFVTTNADDGLARRISTANFPVVRVPAIAHPPDPAGPPHAHWLSASWEADAEVTAQAVAEEAPDWLIWDHYGLDVRWVRKTCAAASDLRVMAIDELDDRPLGAHLVLDQSRITSRARTHTALAKLVGPHYALLRPEFAITRPAALARRGNRVERVLVAPGLTDAAGLGPRALDALSRIPFVSVDVAIGESAVSVETVRRLVATMPQARLHLEAQNMAALMAEVDFCIGGGGMTSWERCTLGLPSAIVPVADNQRQIARYLADAGAAVLIPFEETGDPNRFAAHMRHAFDLAPALSRRAHQICQGEGTFHVLNALSGRLRPVGIGDARLLFDWRNKPRIRAASLMKTPLSWDIHQKWVENAVQCRDGIWCIYTEGGYDLGHINAVERTPGNWSWSFYIGASRAPRGAGGRMCGAFVAKLFRETFFENLTADVLPDNAASIALHKALGFEQLKVNAESGALVFGLRRCQAGLILGVSSKRDFK